MLVLPILNDEGQPAQSDDGPVTITLSQVPDRDRLPAGPRYSLRRTELRNRSHWQREEAAMRQAIPIAADHVVAWTGFRAANAPLECTRSAVVAAFMLRPRLLAQVEAALAQMARDGIVVHL